MGSEHKVDQKEHGLVAGLKDHGRIASSALCCGSRATTHLFLAGCRFLVCVWQRKADVIAPVGRFSPPSVIATPVWLKVSKKDRQQRGVTHPEPCSLLSLGLVAGGNDWVLAQSFSSSSDGCAFAGLRSCLPTQWFLMFRVRQVLTAQGWYLQVCGPPLKQQERRSGRTSTQRCWALAASSQQLPMSVIQTSAMTAGCWVHDRSRDPSLTTQPLPTEVHAGAAADR